jgi:DNA-binding MarR family transcriptional regulator
MSKKENFYLAKLEWLGPILVRGLRVLSSVEALGQEFSFSQAMILQTLLGQKIMQMKDLARYLGLSKANATGLVDRLVKKGLIERTHSADDRRAVIIKLTPAGIRTATKLAAINRKGLAQMMRRIPEKNLVVFLNTLEMVARDLTKTS